ncbi:hypothetical protein AMAG_10349 [Allomyces macrogynus ATCC 38327]|uniref:Uncharacterized protein n=1 Tax=Allomyces macrogynus (strain ATCC 38327) TaxID=578462 RepID=A0A0L0SUM8_ALLM3|nr:hypothetical protein AMAG_10349 [Allomyces macrogynus ATCC 38327]|eukprot:KNE66090.1 hypothetical protein AMAG_10349 [Allomyces macrogynus ATCC 38327]
MVLGTLIIITGTAAVAVATGGFLFVSVKNSALVQEAVPSLVTQSAGTIQNVNSLLASAKDIVEDLKEQIENVMKEATKLTETVTEILQQLSSTYAQHVEPTAVLFLWFARLLTVLGGLFCGLRLSKLLWLEIAELLPERVLAALDQVTAMTADMALDIGESVLSCTVAVMSWMIETAALVFMRPFWLCSALVRLAQMVATSVTSAVAWTLWRPIWILQTVLQIGHFIVLSIFQAMVWVLSSPFWLLSAILDNLWLALPLGLYSLFIALDAHARR